MVYINERFINPGECKLMTAQNNGRPSKSFSVRILDKEYHIACPPEAEDDLQLSAHYLDKQMKSIRRTGKVVGLERIAVMAGLNTSYELLKATRGPAAAAPTVSAPQTATEMHANASSPLVNEKLNELKNRIDEALSAHPHSSETAQINRETTPNVESLLWPEEENSLQVSALEVEY